MTAVSPDDLVYYLSTPESSAGFMSASSPGNSWGGYISTTAVNTEMTLDNIFQDVNGQQNASGVVDYACLFIKNSTTSGNTATSCVAWMPEDGVVAGGCTVALAPDPTGVTEYFSSLAQALTIVTPYIAPAGVTDWVGPAETSPSSPGYADGAVLGSIPPGFVAAFWIRRTATDSPPLANDGFRLQLNFDSMG